MLQLIADVSPDAAAEISAEYSSFRTPEEIDSVDITGANGVSEGLILIESVFDAFSVSFETVRLSEYVPDVKGFPLMIPSLPQTSPAGSPEAVHTTGSVNESVDSSICVYGVPTLPS